MARKNVGSYKVDYKFADDRSARPTSFEDLPPHAQDEIARRLPLSELYHLIYSLSRDLKYLVEVYHLKHPEDNKVN